MHSTVEMLVDRLDAAAKARCGVLHWGSPVPAFGDPSSSTIATVGINPSNREFVSELGSELSGVERRFHTLGSLGLRSWSEAEDAHVDLIVESCRSYFLENPYNTWFKRLERIIAGAGATYYGTSPDACHLDLIPFATERKWAHLTAQQRRGLLESGGTPLGHLLLHSSVEVLLLNGATVVRQFEHLVNKCLEKRQVREWSLPRKSDKNVMGYASRGWIESIGGVDLGRRIQVLGVNHNIQSSFGVTNEVMRAIRDWVGSAVRQGSS